LAALDNHVDGTRYGVITKGTPRRLGAAEQISFENGQAENFYVGLRT